MKSRQILITFALLLLLAPLAFGGDMDEGRQAGESGAKLILNQMNSSSGIQNHITNPMMSSNTKMTTFGTTYKCSSSGALFTSLSECQSRCPGGTCSKYQGFNAQIEAPSSKFFLKVRILPNNSTEDFKVFVSQDTDMNGSTDYSFAPVFKTTSGSTTNYASGVCTHGVIACDPGTWDYCAYYIWTVDPSNGHLDLEQVSNNDSRIGTCYCVNNSCGGILRSAYSQVLDSLGTGAASALAEAQHIVISQAKKDLTELSVQFYGQEATGIAHAEDPTSTYTAGPGGSTTSPETLENAYSTGALPTDEEIVNQSANPNSYYSMLTSSPAMENESVSTYTCTIRHDVTVKQETRQLSTSGSGTWGTDHLLAIKIHKNGNTVEFQWLNTGPGGDVCHNGCGPCGWTKAGSVDLSGIPQNSKVTGYYFHASYSGEGCDGGSGTALFLDQSVWLTGACGADGCQYPTVSWNGYVEYQHDVLNLTTTGACNPGDNCRLKEEKVCDWNGENCIYTVQNYNPTGLKPLASCRTVTGLYSYTVCNDGSQVTAQQTETGSTQTVASGSDLWWHIERTYVCKTDKKYDFDLTSAKTAYSTADPGSGQYEQKVKQNGQYVSQNMNLPLSAVPTQANQCEMACVVTKAGATDTTAYPIEGNKATETESATTKEFTVKKCVQDNSGNWHCPLDEGETRYKPVDKECGCIDMFTETVTTLQGVIDAAHDMICSSSPPD